MKNNTVYQYHFSRQHTKLYNFTEREQKARKILSVLSDYFDKTLDSLNLLDVGCSTGIMTHLLSQHFHRTLGIDIDEAAIKRNRIGLFLSNERMLTI